MGGRAGGGLAGRDFQTLMSLHIFGLLWGGPCASNWRIVGLVKGDVVLGLVCMFVLAWVLLDLN